MHQLGGGHARVANLQAHAVEVKSSLSAFGISGIEGVTVENVTSLPFDDFDLDVRDPSQKSDPTRVQLDPDFVDLDTLLMPQLALDVCLSLSCERALGLSIASVSNPLLAVVSLPWLSTWAAFPP